MTLPARGPLVKARELGRITLDEALALTALAAEKGIQSDARGSLLGGFAGCSRRTRT